MLIIFFFNDTATTEIYTLSLHDALPILAFRPQPSPCSIRSRNGSHSLVARSRRSEEHTSELQSRLHLVCRLLLEKKKQNTYHRQYGCHMHARLTTHHSPRPHHALGLQL